MISPDEVQNLFNARAVKKLGRGAFGETWLVEMPDKTAAVKFLFPTTPLDRVDREVAALKKVASRHVAAYYHSGSFTRGDGSRVQYIACEYIPGGNLRDHLTQNHWPSSEEALQFARGILSGLRDLHAVEVVHRDLSLTNIILRAGNYGDPVLIDLGWARHLDLSSITAYPHLTGTLPFMAPEQLRGERSYPGTDLWAAGVILYFLCTRRHPFYGTSPRDVQTALQDVHRKPDPLPPQVNPALRRVIMTLLSLSPVERGSARRLLRELGVG